MADNPEVDTAEKEVELLKLQQKQLDLEQEKAKSLNSLLEKAIPLIEKYYSTKLEKIEAPKFKYTLIIFSFLLFVVVIGTGILVFYGKVSSENFTFLIGILIGSVITFLRDIIIEAQQ